jgi:Glycosyltransferase family 87
MVSSIEQELRTIVNAQRAFTLFIFVGLSTFYFVTFRSVNSHVTDFPPLYAAARLLQTGQNPYDIEAQCNVQRAIRPGLCMPFNHTPLLLPLIRIITTGDYEGSFRRWCVILVVVIGLCLIPAYRLSGNVEASLQAMLFLPVFISITQGQDTAFILLSIFIWTVLLVTSKDFWAGMALALAVVKPHIALLLAIPLLFSRPKAFLGFCVGGLLAASLSLYLVGLSGLRGLIEITRISARGQVFGVNHLDMYSAAGVFARAGISPYWAWPVFALGLFGLSVFWRKYGTSINSLCLGIVTTVIAAPHLLMHDLAVLAIPIYLVHPLAPILASFILLASRAGGHPYAGAYVVMTIVTIFHVQQRFGRKDALPPTHRSVS